MFVEAIRHRESDRAPAGEPQAADGLLHLRTQRAPADHLPTVLVVDDDVFVCRAVGCILREARAVQVYSARNGEEAVALAQEVLPDVVILDIMMPGMPAVEICRALRAMPELEQTRICVLTGIMADQTVTAALAPHINQVMTKPPDPRALVALLDES